MWVQSLGWDDPLEEGIATSCNILAWRIPRQRSLAGYGPQGHEELAMTEAIQQQPQQQSLMIFYISELSVVICQFSFLILSIDSSPFFLDESG